MSSTAAPDAPRPGYRPLTQRQQDQVAMLHEYLERALRVFDELDKDPDVERRCTAIARANFEVGTMMAVRGVTRPERIRLPEDEPPAAAPPADSSAAPASAVPAPTADARPVVPRPETAAAPAPPAPALQIYDPPMRAPTAVLALLAAAAIAAPLAACGPYQLTESERSTAELGARDYADRTQADYVGCSGQDSDKDGYVTCSTKARAAPNAVSEILCSYGAGARGCKRKA